MVGVDAVEGLVVQCAQLVAREVDGAHVTVHERVELDLGDPVVLEVPSIY